MTPGETIDVARAAARLLGWAIGVHGTLDRDIDLIAVPWTAEAAPWTEVMYAIQKAVGYQGALGNYERKPCGRLAVLLVQHDYRVVRKEGGKVWVEPKPLDVSFVDPRCAPATHAPDARTIADVLLRAQLEWQEAARRCEATDSVYGYQAQAVVELLTRRQA